MTKLWQPDLWEWKTDVHGASESSAFPKEEDHQQDWPSHEATEKHCVELQRWRTSELTSPLCLSSAFSTHMLPMEMVLSKLTESELEECLQQWQPLLPPVPLKGEAAAALDCLS